jgi:hypothetical protein
MGGYAHRTKWRDGRKEGHFRDEGNRNSITKKMP